MPSLGVISGKWACATAENIDPVVDLLRSRGLSLRYLVEKRQTLEELFMEAVDANEPGVDRRAAQAENVPMVHVRK